VTGGARIPKHCRRALYIVRILIYRLMSGRFTITMAVTAATINTPSTFEIRILPPIILLRCNLAAIERDDWQ
jgi:hypothetical protein